MKRKFCLFTIEDMATYGYWDTLESLFDTLEKELTNGITIQFEFRFFNSDPEIDTIIHTQEDLQNFKMRFKK